MELMACVRAVHIAAGSNLHIYTDSEYVVKSMNTWSTHWKMNGWKTREGRVVANLELLRYLHTLKLVHGIGFEHVPAHRPEPMFDNNSTSRLSAFLEKHAHWAGNSAADKLAREATTRQQQQLQTQC
jgi:hypothetical protein